MDSVFILRLKPKTESGLVVNRAPEALKAGKIFLGWNCAGDLRSVAGDVEEIKRRIEQAYLGDRPSKRDRASAAQGAGSVCRFLHVMSVGDCVIVPDAPRAYVARVTGEPCFERDRVPDGIANQRAVEWLFDGRAVDSRKLAAVLGINYGRHTCRGPLAGWTAERLEQDIRRDLRRLGYGPE